MDQKSEDGRLFRRKGQDLFAERIGKRSVSWVAAHAQVKVAYTDWKETSNREEPYSILESKAGMLKLLFHNYGKAFDGPSCRELKRFDAQRTRYSAPCSRAEGAQ